MAISGKKVFHRFHGFLGTAENHAIFQRSPNTRGQGFGPVGEDSHLFVTSGLPKDDVSLPQPEEKGQNQGKIFLSESFHGRFLHRCVCGASISPEFNLY